MGTLTSRIMITAFLLLFTLVSGFWLSHLGKPMNGAILTVHKLAALATVVLSAMVFSQLRRGAGITTIAVAAVMVTGMAFLALFVTGALLSIGKPAHAAVLTIHQVALVLAAGAGAVTTYLLTAGRTA